MVSNLNLKARSALKAALPFYYSKEPDYDRWDALLDVEKLIFLGAGSLEAILSLGMGDIGNAAYASRNLPLYVMSCIPHYNRGQEKGEVTEILTDKKTVATLMLPLAIDLPRNIVDLYYDAQFDAFEAKFGFGPTTPQHFALGYCLSRATRYVVDGFERIGRIGHKLGSVIKSFLPGTVMIGYEGIEWTMPELLDTKVLDMFADLFSDFAGQTTEILSARRRNYSGSPYNRTGSTYSSISHQSSPLVGD